MNIRPSAAIRQNYSEIAEMCRKTAEPVFLTKNGEGDLVVMDIETYNRREKMLKLREELLAVEEDRIVGTKKPSNGNPLEDWILWRRRRDSNPRAPKDKRISSAPRYDHFDTSPSHMCRGLIMMPQLLHYIRIPAKRKA